MNWRHFQAVVWLRWRIFLNQMKRGGTVNLVIQTLLTVFALVGGVCAAVVLSVAMFLVGMFALRDAAPAIVMFVWDGVVAVFLFAWMIGILAELQRSDPLSLDKFLHLPVSITGIFLINYISSLVNLVLLVFVPSMFALSIGLAFSKGPMLLLLLPLVVALVLMVTALTYQLQGWLAALMVNKRRRRTVIVFLTMGFIVICQLPNLINMVVFSRHQPGNTSNARMLAEQSELRDALSRGDITVEEFQKRVDESQRAQKSRAEEAERQTLQQVENTAWIVNLCLPPGWLPLGAMTSVEGNALAPPLAFLGMAGIGAVSLWRAHQTTVRLYTGKFNSGKRRSIAVAIPAKQTKPLTAGLLEWRLPMLSEQASAVALSGIQSLARAPEAKMLLLGPILLVVVFGGTALSHSLALPAVFRPFMAFGGMTMILLTMIQLVGNQFGFDRGGFRVFVLSAAPRREVLLGKNMAVAPLALGLGAVILVLLQAAYPMRWDYFLAALPQALTMFLLFCLLANWLSIYAPTLVRTGSFKPANPKGLTLLLQLAFLFLFPWALAPALLALGVELGLEQLGWAMGLPICLALSVLECAVVVYVYRLILNWQGQTLHRREQKILAVVTPKAE